MKYDTTFINRNFLLKVYGVDSENRRINRLVGADDRDIPLFRGKPRVVSVFPRDLKHMRPQLLTDIRMMAEHP